MSMRGHDVRAAVRGRQAFAAQRRPGDHKARWFTRLDSSSALSLRSL